MEGNVSLSEKIVILFTLLIAYVIILIIRINTNKIQDDNEERKASEDLRIFVHSVEDRLFALRIIIAIIILGIIFLIFGGE